MEAKYNQIGEKLRVAREKLGLSQIAIAKEIGIKQTGVSAMETGTYERFNFTLFQFLVKCGVNVNLIFDETVTPGEFRKNYRISKQLFLPAPDGFDDPHAPEGCLQCKAKDGIIDAQKMQIEVLYGTVGVLKGRLDISQMPPPVAG